MTNLIGKLLEKLNFWLENLVLISILDKLAKLSILFAAATYLITLPDQQREAKLSKHRQAWIVINSAHGVSGNGGRVRALQELNEDGVSLSRINLSGASLVGVDLEGADLSYANFSGANLTEANLADSNLEKANFSNAKLAGATITKSVLNEANLERADLSGANMDGSMILNAKLNELKFGTHVPLNRLSQNGLEVLLYRSSIRETNGLSDCKKLAKTIDWQNALRSDACGHTIPKERVEGYVIGSG